MLVTYFFDDRTHITLAGDIDLAWAVSVAPEVDRVVEECAAHATVDLSDVTFMDASGLSFIARLVRRCREQNGHVYLYGAPPVCVRILTVSGLLEQCDLGPQSSGQVLHEPRRGNPCTGTEHRAREETTRTHPWRSSYS